jgi:glyoxalase family protein
MASFPRIPGLHHVTAMTGDPKRNLDFYTRLLGQRLVKKTVNFDDPTTYHFYFADALGTPGTVVTFFPWPHAAAGTLGTGETSTVAYHAPAGSLDSWEARLSDRGVSTVRQDRFGETILAFRDPAGTRLEIVATGATPDAVTPWTKGPVPEDMLLRGFHGVTLQLAHPEATQNVLEAMGYREAARVPEGSGERIRLEVPGSRGATIDLLSLGHALPGRFGQASIHHIAFRVLDDQAQEQARRALQDLGLNVTEVKDRMYFRSIYAREPGSVLFEFATDPPGFATDESTEDLGTSLTLPAWLEPRRDELQNALPTLE